MVVDYKEELWIMDSSIEEMLRKCDSDTIEEISNYCNIVKHKNRDKRLNDEYAENAKLIGKCYRRKMLGYNKFYKVVSVKSNNSARVSCLTFSEYPSAEFCSSLHFGWSHPNEGSIDFDGVYISDPMVNDLVKWDEISEELYNKYLDEYIAALKTFNWEDV